MKVVLFIACAISAFHWTHAQQTVQSGETDFLSGLESFHEEVDEEALEVVGQEEVASTSPPGLGDFLAKRPASRMLQFTDAIDEALNRRRRSRRRFMNEMQDVVSSRRRCCQSGDDANPTSFVGRRRGQERDARRRNCDRTHLSHRRRDSACAAIGMDYIDEKKAHAVAWINIAMGRTANFETRPGRGGCPEDKLLYQGVFTSEVEVQKKCNELNCAYYTWSFDPSNAKHGAWVCAVDNYASVSNAFEWPLWRIGRPITFETKAGRGGCPADKLIFNGVLTSEAEVQQKCRELSCAFYTWSNDPSDAQHGAWLCAVDNFRLVSAFEWPLWRVGRRQDPLQEQRDRWFGEGHNRVDVQARLNGIADMVSTDFKINYPADSILDNNCDDAVGRNAYVNNDQHPGEIFICKHFSTQSDAVQVGTILHEVSHMMTSAPRTTDLCYNDKIGTNSVDQTCVPDSCPGRQNLANWMNGWCSEAFKVDDDWHGPYLKADTLWLAKNAEDAAIKNAQNFEFYIRDVVESASTSCYWRTHGQKYSAGFADGVQTEDTEAGAKKECIKMGLLKCRAVTCIDMPDPDDVSLSRVVCTLRASVLLTDSPQNEVTYQPTARCY